MISEVSIRPAKSEDCAAILDLIRELAVFEKAEKEVELSADRLCEDAFGADPIVEMWVAEIPASLEGHVSSHLGAQEKTVVGTAIFYEKYSTWKGRSLHLEDLVVKSAFRRRGIGDLLFREVIRIAVERDYARLDWQVLDWNESAIAFYRKYGADISTEWFNGRFDREGLKKALRNG